MANFQFQALNAQRQRVFGELQADSVAHALTQLEARGLTVESIGYVQADSAAVPPFADREAAQQQQEAAQDAPAEQAALRSHMERVLERGQTMVPALRAFAEELPDGNRRRQLSQAIDVLERGDAEEATAHLGRLPEFWIPLLSAATASHDPGRILSQFLDESQRAAELRRQWFQALAYPMLIGLLAIGVLTALSILVVPMFREMFTEFDLPLPRLTVFVLDVAAWISSGKILLALVIVVALGFLLVRLSSRLPASFRVWFSDRFGTPLGRRTAVARLSQFAAELLDAGLDVPATLRIAGYCAQSPRLQRAAWRVAREAERNEGLPPLKQHNPLTQTVLHALRGDMPQAARIRLLREVGQCHAQRVRTQLSWTRGTIEPIAIGAIGLVVGCVVLALFLPLISLIRGLSGG